MSTTTTPHAPGTFCWVEHGSRDAEAAKRFYPALLGWTIEETPIPGGTYIMCRRDGHTVAAMYQLSAQELAQGIPSHWFPYVAVASADDAAARAAELGGSVEAPPFDVMEHGRMAVLKDPTGGHFGVWEARAHIGAQMRDEPGALCWNELMTRDPRTAARFYADLMGYELSSMAMPAGDYTIMSLDGAPRGGCMAITPEMGDVPTGWLTYFAVADCDATATRARELGGQVLTGPVDAPGVGRWALLQDPTGGVVSVIALAA
jgi:predicted enzyme related to lactoylglutathione lyase